MDSGMRNMTETLDGIVAQLEARGSEANRAGMARYGINVERAFGVSVYELRRMAVEYRRNHDLALALWARGLHETRLLAVFVDDPRAVTREQMEQWSLDFDSWDICDQATTSLFDQTPHAWPAVAQWAVREEEWVKRGAFAMLAGLAVHDKRASNEQFEATSAALLAASTDPRNFVKKAVNWAIRNIGKRNPHLNGAMVELCNDLLQGADRSAADGNKSAASTQRWIARDALRELTSEKAQARLAAKGQRR